MNNNLVLKQGNVEIRPIRWEDTANIIKWRNSEDVRRNFIWQGNLTEEIHAQWLHMGGVVQYIILIKCKPVGTVYLRDIDEISKSAELGIFIGESSYRNQGIGNCVFDIFVDKIVKFFDLSRIYLRVLAFNKNALNLYQHAGFVIDKIEQKAVCKNGEFVDVIFMSKVF